MSEIRSVIIQPFIDVLPWIMEHPHSKRLPNGVTFSGMRRGLPSIIVLCNAWQTALETWRGVITDDDMNQMDKAFTLMNELYPDDNNL